MANIGLCLYNTSMSSYVINKHLHYLTRQNSLFVFHIDSLTKDRSSNSWDNPFHLPSFDLGSSSVAEIQDLFVSKNIEVFVFYTFQSQLDKLLWKICQLLKIPTILHDHGIVYGESVVGVSYLNISWIRIRRTIKFVLYRFQYIGLQIKYKRVPFSNVNYSFDHYLFYSMNNIRYYQNFFTLNKFNTSISGIPLFLNKSEIDRLKNKTKKSKLLYICQPFTKLGISSATIEEEVCFLNDINQLAKKFNLKFEIRLHPSQTIDEFGYNEWDSNISFDNTKDLQDQSATAFAIIGHWSTALAISHPLDVPLIILAFPKVKQTYQKFYSIFKDVSYYCDNVKQLEESLNLINNNNTYEDNNVKWEHLIGTRITVESDCEMLLSIISSLVNMKTQYNT